MSTEEKNTSFIKQIKKTVSAFNNKFTGREINEKIEIYTELLGQIVIGMDKMLEDQKNVNAQLNNRIQSLEKELKSVRKKQIGPARWLYVCLVVLILMNIILGAALWIKT
ncbi:hypothetical protein [Caldithrix abyssi]